MLVSKYLFKIDSISTNIKQVIAALKKSYDGRPDGIPSSLLKYGSREFPLSCLKLFSLYMDFGVYPSVQKTSLITPRFKLGSCSGIANYSPINLTSVISSTKEKNLQTAISLSSSSKRPCIASHLEFFDQITQRTDVGQPVIILFFDFNNVFDSVSHKLLIKLSSFGIRNHFLSQLKSFSGERSQIVHFAPFYFKHVNVTSGIIKGNVIGPLPFPLFIDDVCSLF